MWKDSGRILAIVLYNFSNNFSASKSVFFFGVSIDYLKKWIII